ncbi:MAG TPA: deoxyguanosinetriphosphate triphosphohydrolase [Candidatus Acidoferrum sp.]|nr:deoxyguanosinetriphosphate triphosphohydrolase [Candidatus Acidoferrum sp.]
MPAPLPVPYAMPYAMDVTQSRGRKYPEPEHPYRGAYARDRDRIIHARAFRRLEAKTQVFTTRYSDHFRNRLTHTLEVAQIARTVAGALGLNTDLAEALALVHDIGHPPFGHAGEHKLDELLQPFGLRFDHNLHALRIVELLEQRYAAFPGLNLTFEVREGIVKHSHEYRAAEHPELAEYLLDLRPPIEGQLIDFVDEIAYNTADMDDGIEGGLISIAEACGNIPFLGDAYEAVRREYPSATVKVLFSEANRRLLDHLATDLIETTRARIAEHRIRSVEDARRFSGKLAGFSATLAETNIPDLKKFLLANLYNHPAIVEDRERSVAALGELFYYYMERPESLPKFFLDLEATDGRARIVADYIAGMTDHFLLRLHRELLGPATTQ